MTRKTRRAVLATASAAILSPRWAIAGEDGAHGFSPLGRLKYGPGEPFAYVNPDAPKGGTYRAKTMRAFDGGNTLRYPSRTPADLRCRS